MLSLVKMRELNIDDQYSLRGPVLQKAIDVSTHFAPCSLNSSSVTGVLLVLLSITHKRLMHFLSTFIIQLFNFL